MFICGMLLRCAGTLNPSLILDQYSRFDTADLTLTVVFDLAILGIRR